MTSGASKLLVLLSAGFPAMFLAMAGCTQNCEVAQVEKEKNANVNTAAANANANADIKADAPAGPKAPDFAFKTVDGKSAKLSDYRGKYVLVDFWATWCGPCRGEMPHLKAAYDAYGKDGKFEIIGLSLDDDPSAPKSYAAKNKLTWVQGFLGSPSPVADQFGVNAIPHILLIGPDGRIVAEDLRGTQIKKTVGEALGQS